MRHKPMILYYDHGQKEKKIELEKAVKTLGISLVSITPSDFLQTVGHLAKVKGFPAKKVSPFEACPQITKEMILLCNFKEETLDALLLGMKNNRIPYVPLKAVLTAQNCFWTFAQLFQELEEEHENFYSES